MGAVPGGSEGGDLSGERDALTEYYAKVIGTGPAERSAARMHGLAGSLRSGGRGTGWQQEAADAITGITRGYALHKGLQGDREREKALSEATSEFLRRKQMPQEMVPGQYSTADPKYG